MKTAHFRIDQETGVIICEEYRLDRKLHRDEKEGPARIERCLEGWGIEEERYYLHGNLHRVDGPAVVSYCYQLTVPEDGKRLRAIWQELYYRNGKLHRDPKEGPASIKWNYFEHDITSDAFKIVIEEIYSVHGVGYRDPSDGPYATTRSSDDGKVLYETYSESNGASARCRARRGRVTFPPGP